MLGGKVGVPTPKRLDSVEVHNKMKVPCTVSVVFDNHKDQVQLQEDHQLDAGATYHFQEKVLDMGSWTAIAPVKHVTVSHANGSHSLEPSVSGIVKKMAVHVNDDGQLTQGETH